ncbi:MAG: molybdopterin-dependent oxidoreductase, partial [Arenimonas sp.]
RSVSRYVDRKRVIADEDMGPLVATDMTRCIQCTRCVRFTADIAGTYELGGMSRGENLQIGTYDGKPLMTELSGNVIDVCPVGALTNKVFRYRARAWELIARDSFGYHDAFGSNLHLHVHRGEVVRTVPRDNEAINECWLSDRDRYSHQGMYAADRALRPMLRDANGWREVQWEEALVVAADLIRKTEAAQLGVLAHPATSNEEGLLLAAMAKALGTGNVDHRLRQLDFADAAVAEPFAMASADIEKASVVLLVGCNIRHELPLVHQRLLKAGKRGAKIFAINPVDFDFAFRVAGTRIVAPSKLGGALAALVQSAGGSLDAGLSVESDKELAPWAEAFKAAEGNAVIILGEIDENHANASHLRAAARALAQATGAKLNRIPQGANGVGLAQHGLLPSGQGRDVASMLASPLSTYILFGIEPQFDFASGASAAKALSAADVIAFSAFASEELKAVAKLILPIGLLPEIEASMTSLDGIEQTSVAGGKLPGEARSGWRVLRALIETLALPDFDFTDINGLRARVKESARVSGTGLAERVTTGAGLERIVTTPIYRGDAVLRRAIALNAHPLTLGARVILHPEDASARGLADGAVASVADGKGVAALPVTVSTRVARGAVWIESDYAATAPLSPTASLDVKGT